MTSSNFLLLGPEQGEKDSYIRDIKAKIVTGCGGTPEEHSFYAFDADMVDVAALLRTPSLFSPVKFVTIHDVDAIKAKSDVDLLVSYLKSPSRDSCLFLLSSQVQIDKRFEQYIPKDHVKIFWELFENQKQGFIKAFFRQQGMEIDGKAAELLLDLVENNTMDLRRECERIALFFKGRESIQEEDLAGFLYHSKDENVYSLFAKMAEKDAGGAFEILEKLYQAGDTADIQILAGLFWQYKKLAPYKLLQRYQYKPEEMCSRLGLRTKRTQRLYEAAAARYSEEELKDIIILATHCDSALRADRADLHKPLVSHFIFCCVRGISDVTFSLYR